MELIINMSIICIVTLLLMQYMRFPNSQPNTISHATWSYHFLLILCFAFTLFFVSAFRVGFQDTGVYKNLYTSIGTDLSNALDDNFIIKDKGFNVFMVLLNRLNTEPQTLIIVSSAIIIGAYIYVICKYSSDLPFSLLLMLCLSFIATMNGIRQIIAVAITLLGWSFLQKKQIIPFLIIAFLASTFHASAIFLVPLSLIIIGKRYNKGIWFFVLFILFFFVFPNTAFKIMGSILEDSVYEKYLENDSKMGIMRLIVECVPLSLSLLYHRATSNNKLSNDNNSVHRKLIDMLMNMQIISVGFLALGLQMVYFSRLCLYFSLVSPLLLPEVIPCIFTKRSAHLVKRLAIIMYLIYFAYQIYTYEMIDNWGGMELIF